MYKALIVLILISFTGCQTENKQKKQQNKQELQSKNIKVKTNIAVKSIFNKQILTNGIIKATKKTNLHFKNTGYLQHIYAKNGNLVKKGTLIASLDNKLLYNALKSKEIARDKAKQKYEELLLSYDINDSLNTVHNKKLLLQSGLAEAQNQLQEAHIRYQNSMIYAPFSGIVANCQTTTGNLISPSDTIATLINPNTYHVVFKLMENEVSLVKKGLQIDIQSLSNKQQTQKAIIDDINPVIAPDGTALIKAKITGNSHRLIEGTHTDVIVNIPVSDMILIPKEALVIRSDKDVVFTLHQGKFAKWNYVEVFGENKTHYAISKGLKEGDTIIVSNNMNLAHDAVVEVEPSK